jgi:protein gp37
VTGCTKISIGCKNCYAETMTNRFENQWGGINKQKTGKKLNGKIYHEYPDPFDKASKQNASMSFNY